MNGCEVQDATGKVLVVGERFGCLHRLKLAETSNQVQGKVHHLDCQHQWHRRLGHRDPTVISRINNENLGVGLNVSDCGIRQTCEPCQNGGKEIDEDFGSGAHRSVRTDAYDNTRGKEVSYDHDRRL